MFVQKHEAERSITYLLKDEAPSGKC